MGAWLREERAEFAVDRLLDAAEAAFAEHGPERTRMEHVARAARCSRGTLYRYFGNREELRRAYVAREVMRIGAEVAERVAPLDDPAERLVEAIAAALEGVRKRPALEVWFAPDAAGSTHLMATASGAIHEFTAAFLGELFEGAAAVDRPDESGDLTEGGGRLRGDVDLDEATDWVVRIVLSFLANPLASGPDAERARLHRYLTPALFSGPQPLESARSR